MPFSTETIGPLTYRDVVNVGYNSMSGDPQLCLANGGEVSASTSAPAATVMGDSASEPRGRPFACRLLQRLKVLWVDARRISPICR